MKLLVIKSHVARSLGIHVGGKYWICSQLAEAIKVELPSKTRKIRMFEVFWQNRLRNGTTKVLAV